MANFETRALSAGLYLVATPIGTARDITLRALDILASADVIAAEDTRNTRRLMEIHGIPLGGRRLVAYHDHNGAQVRPQLIDTIAQGGSVAYASDAGTPLVADPGYALARDVAAAGLPVTHAPGPSALLAGLCVSGLPSDRFLFCGFLPNTSSARRSALSELVPVAATLIFFESPNRIHAMLSDLAQVLGEDRKAVVARELTKRFEEVLRGTLGELVQRTEDTRLKGEIVVLVDRGEGLQVTEDMLEDTLRRALETQSVKDAAATVAQATGLPRRKVYQLALRLAQDD